MYDTNTPLDLTKPAVNPGVAPKTASIKALSTPNTATAAFPKTGATGLGSAWKAAVPAQVNDSVADKVKSLTSQDSALMQQAKTDGLRVANRRGLLNSSMAVGASQDAMVSKALPIASQDASQAYGKNMAARDFQFRMEGQDDDQQFQGGQSALDRTLQKDLQGRDITSRESMAADDRALQSFMQGRDITSREGMASLERDLQKAMQTADISSREGLAAAERALQQKMQYAALNTANSQQAKEIANQQAMQRAEIAYQNKERSLDRGLQEKLAGWNLKSSDRNAAAQFLTNMESMYADNYSSIMANTNLDAATRNAMLASAKNLRDKQLNFVEQMYVVDLNW